MSGRTRKTRIDDTSLAVRVFEDIAGVPLAEVTSVETKDKTIHAPALFDLLTLQKEANKRFGATATATLQIAQSLYETHKLLSYPRTESRHLSRDIVPGLPAVIDAAWYSFPEAAALAEARFPTLKLPKSYVDDTKLTDHHAIIPTTAKPTRTPPLGHESRRFTAWSSPVFSPSFCRRSMKAETAALFAIGPHTFRAKGSVVKEPGWTSVHSAKPEGKKRSKAADDSDDEKAQKLPPLEKGERCKKSSQSLETRVTKPPKSHTDASLLDAMKKAGASIDDEDLAATMKRCGLGTPATRAAIIERLLKTGYVERSKKELLPTGKGIDLIAQVEEELRDPALTAQWEQRLKDIEEGKLTAEAFEADIVTHLKSLLPKVFTAAPPCWHCRPCRGAASGRPGNVPAVPRRERSRNAQGLRLQPMERGMLFHHLEADRRQDDHIDASQASFSPARRRGSSRGSRARRPGRSSTRLSFSTRAQRCVSFSSSLSAIGLGVTLILTPIIANCVSARHCRES